MQSNNNFIPGLIQLTQTDQVNLAEAELSKLAASDPTFLNQLIDILKNYEQYNIKLSIATYLNTAICDNLFNKTPQEYATLLANILSDTSIDSACKRVMERCIVSIIDSIQDPQLTQFRELVFTLIKNQKLRDSAYLLIGCFCIPDSVDLQHVIYLTRVFMIETLGRLVLPNSAATMYLFKEYNQILKTWIVAWDRLAKHDNIQSKSDKKSEKQQQPKTVFEQSKLLMQICESDQFYSTILQVYQWFCQSPVYICTDAQLYDINLLKQSASELHYRALQFTYRKNQGNKILEVTEKIIGNIFNNLGLAAANPTMLDQFECRDFVTNLIKVARFFILCKPTSISNDWKQILQNVVFPFMKYNEEELATFDESPTDFVTLFEDCAEKQTFGIAKTQACKLLQKLSDKSEEITQLQFITDFIINFSVDSIKNYFGAETQNFYEMKYVNFDVAMTALCIFSFRLENHRSKLSHLRYLFNKQKAMSLKPYDRTLFYLFLGYNYGEVYEKPEEGSFWIEIALQDNSHPTTQFCAIDFMFNVADQFYSDYFVQQISNKMLTHTSPTLFDSVQKLVRTQFNLISPGLMIEVIHKIYQRLEIQLNNVQKSEVKETIIIIKLINIINTLTQAGNYCNEHENVKNQIWKLMGVLEKAKQLDIESGIYAIMLSLLKKENQISNTSKSMLGTVLLDFAADEYYEIYFYQILNQFITKSTFDVIPPILKSVSTGIIYHVFGKGENLKKSQRKLILSHLLLLLQNILAYFGSSMPEINILQIGSICMNFIPQNGEPITAHVVLARALNVLLFCHMLNKTDVVIKYLLDFHDKQIYFNYDIRVFLACVKVEIQKENDVTTCAQFICMAANMISGFRKRQKLDANSKKIQAKYGKDNRLKLNKYKEYQKLVKDLDTPFKSQKKLQALLNEIIQLAKGNNQKFKLIYANFSDKQRNLICSVCNIPENQLMGRRVVYTVLKPKAPEDVKIEQNEGMKNSSDEEEYESKRKRQEMKKTKKAKSKKNKEDDEMQ